MIESWSLSNGVRVLFVERRELPIVAVRVVSSTGAGDLPGERPGAVAFMGAMLEQGAGKRSALELSDDYEALGVEHGAWCDWDACVARVKVLSARLASALELLADVVLRPSLSDAEIERVRKRWLASLEQEKNSPAVMEQNAIAAVLYGRGHPYGHGLRGTPADVAQRRRDEIERTWRRAFAARSTTIVVAGDVARDDLRGLLEARFGGIRGEGAARSPVAPAPAPSGPSRDSVRVALVDVPGAAQSQVFVAEPGAPFSSDDRIALGVMNAILGGMFSSRINLDLREAHAYTYGAHSRFSMRHGAGPFAAGGAIFTAHTGEAVRALLGHIARIRDEAVTDDELSDAKENAKLALPARFEGVDDVAGALQDLAVYGLALDEYAVRAARIDAVTAQEVQHVAKKWLHPGTMRVVVTGDRAKIDPDLAALGPIELRDAYGDPVK
jgi:predicted Zn-dependent peptidase